MQTSLPVVAIRSLSLPLALMALLMLPAPAAHAIMMTFVGNLSAANEVPSNAPPGPGLATIFLDPTAQTLQVNVTFSGLPSTDTAAHIHCCAPLGTNPCGAPHGATF